MTSANMITLGRATMRSIKLAVLFASTLFSLLAPLTAAGQQSPRIARIGWMSVGPPTAPALNYEVFRKAMLELGYLEGKNVVYEPRYTSGKNEVLPELIADLERAGVDVIVAGPFAALRVRSEERRVGKECRARVRAV